MAIFAISDLHLSLGGDKPMDVFGSKWEDYTEKMKSRWNSIITDEDIVVIPGDISWATYIDDAVFDFEYINSLNGRKLILKGNHDYWWTTQNKMRLFLERNSFDTIEILQNSAYFYNGTAVCGTRGWIIPSAESKNDDRKIFEREKQRLILSLESAKALKPNEIIVAMHYPPIDKNNINSDFLNIMKEYKVSECVFGHLHAAAHAHAPVGIYDNIKLRLVSCDYLNFTPILINRLS